MIEIGLFEDALALLDEMDLEIQKHPRGLRILMFCALAQGSFRSAEKVALYLTKSGSEEKASAAVVLHRLAGIKAKLGDHRSCSFLARAAVEADPQQLERMQDDPDIPNSCLPSSSR
ncbi:hypothetical protein OJ996_05035 [Luteolibacter sp. GHJ8]|uniref:Uncharacterized protein n=1 Tax=Luteolibacter rhizosphaerae TaxID=2989719 RepID=A0ABT3FZA2_9BACT|nr:hypothetical protein [Luteolibacter rhizosphaerae]MCW1912925.1 hypothetical protein [Luteolibacter rhizosphaerae]